jgi:hypothetical protein
MACTRKLDSAISNGPSPAQSMTSRKCVIASVSLGAEFGTLWVTIPDAPLCAVAFGLVTEIHRSPDNQDTSSQSGNSQILVQQGNTENRAEQRF